MGLLTPALNDISTLALYLFFTFCESRSAAALPIILLRLSPFLVLSIGCALALLFALFIVPETRGVSLEEMAAVRPFHFFFHPSGFPAFKRHTDFHLL